MQIMLNDLSIMQINTNWSNRFILSIDAQKG